MRASSTKFLLMLALMISSASARAQEGLIPDYAVVQHAGSIGYVSGGLGYYFFKDDAGSAEISYGVVPESKGGPLHIVTAKFAYRPIEVMLTNKVKIHPFNPGLFFSYHTDDQFDIVFDQEQYGKSYYGWSTAIRAHLSASNEIKFHTGSKLKSVTLYSEFNVSDLYLASIFYKNNRKWLKPQDIIKLGIGIRAGF